MYYFDNLPGEPYESFENSDAYSKACDETVRRNRLLRRCVDCNGDIWNSNRIICYECYNKQFDHDHCAYCNCKLPELPPYELVEYTYNGKTDWYEDEATVRTEMVCPACEQCDLITCDDCITKHCDVGGGSKIKCLYCVQSHMPDRRHDVDPWK